MTIDQIDRSFSSFGFLTGGSFNITLYSEDSQIFVVGLLNRSELKKSFAISPTSACANSSILSRISSFFELHNFVATWRGNISDNEILQPVIVNCNNQPSKSTIYFSYKNPTSYLDSRSFLTIRVSLIFIFIFVVIVISYLISFIQFISFAKTLHWLIFSLIFLELLSEIFTYKRYYDLDKSDSRTIFSLLSVIVEFIAKVLLTSTTILAASGWCILSDVLAYREIFRTFAISSLFYALEIILTNFDTGAFAIIPIILFLILAMEMIKLIIYSIKDAEMLIKAHLIAISKAGIDPSSTPVFQMHITYERYQNCIVIYFLQIVMHIVASLFISIDDWINKLWDGIAQAFLCEAFVIFFRIRKENTMGYSQIGEQDAEILVHDIEGIELSDEEIQNHQLKQWSLGMELPPPPHLVLFQPDIIHEEEENLKLEEEPALEKSSIE